MTLNPQRLGLTIGALLGIWHFIWALLVAIGAAQTLMDWIFRLHFITPPYQIGEFSVGLAVGLIIVTSVFGYLFGFVGGWLWNRAAK